MRLRTRTLSLSLSVLTLMVMLNTGVSLDINAPANNSVFAPGTHLAPGGTGTGFGTTDNELLCQAYNYASGQPAHTAYWNDSKDGSLEVVDGYWAVDEQTDWGLYAGSPWNVNVHAWNYSSVTAHSSGTTNP